ncbi:hypothetical protein HNR44_000728 [Geomicrobium halophilum]|uniref:Uncharacterized protein n=1 Tax=Geomicrobium halophilum TaxID=549000 RepID=A0A841PJ77_9BACL|nr:hypothetical protein [Geomicrobium halophilum]
MQTFLLMRRGKSVLSCVHQQKTPHLTQDDYFEAIPLRSLHARLSDFISTLAQYFLANEPIQESNTPTSQQ